MVSSYNLSTQMAFGQVNRSSLMTNNNSFNQIVDSLRTFKEGLEKDDTSLEQDKPFSFSEGNN